MLNERIKIHIAEAPKGKMLAEETIGVVIQALEGCYPSLKDRYSEKTHIKLRPEPQDIVQQKRISDIPKEKTATEESLFKLELLKTPIYNQWRDENENETFYWNTDPKNEMYIDEKIFYGFNHDNPKDRLNSAITFGQLLIFKTIQSLPTPRKLKGKKRADWKEIAINHLHNLTEELKREKNSMIDPEKLEKLKINTESFTLNYPDARFFAYGAEVRILSPGQTIMYPAYSMGESLNNDIVNILSEEAQLKFISLMKNRFIIFDKDVKQQKSQRKQLSEEWLKNLKLEDKNLIFEMYVSSEIPLLMSDTLA